MSLIIIDKRSLDQIIARMFSDNALINLLDLIVDDKFVVSSDDIAHLNLEHGNGDFLVNPGNLVVYRRRKIMYGSDDNEIEKIGKLVFLKNNKLGIEPI